MSGEYRVVAYSPEHRNAVLELHGRLLPRTRRVTERYFAWKYEENPFLPEPLLALVFAGSSLAAMRGLCGTRWHVPAGGTRVIPAAEDLIIDAPHRNRGLFLLIDRKLAQMAADLGRESMLSLSANATTRKLQDVTGWKRVAASPRSVRDSPQPSRAMRDHPLFRRLRAKGTAVARRAGAEVPERIAGRNVNRMLTGVAKTAPSIRISGEPDPATLAALATPHPDALHQPHSEQFYRWRLDNPDRRYRYVTWSDPKPRGFVTLGFQPDNPQRMMIVDAAADDPGILVALLEAVVGATRPSFTVLPDALPAQVRTELPRLGFVAANESEEDAMVVVFERATSRSAPTHGATRWRTPLLDTMLG